LRNTLRHQLKLLFIVLVFIEHSEVIYSSIYTFLFFRKSKSF
jgi:hypothetical protein